MPPPGSAIDTIRRPHRLPSSLHATARLSDRHVRRPPPERKARHIHMATYITILNTSQQPNQLPISSPLQETSGSAQMKLSSLTQRCLITSSTHRQLSSDQAQPRLYSFCMIDQRNNRSCQTRSCTTVISGASQPATTPVPASQSPLLN